MKLALKTLAVVPLMVSAPAHSAEPTASRSEVLQKLIDCRSIKNDAERLSCYESQTAKIEDAEAKKDVLVIDRAQAEKSRRENFGLPPKNEPFVGLGKGSQPNGASDIRSKIQEARLLKSGKWVLILEDGARWFQTDSETIRDPKPGQDVRIRKAALGSYFANVNGQAAMRVRRVDTPKAN